MQVKSSRRGLLAAMVSASLLWAAGTVAQESQPHPTPRPINAETPVVEAMVPAMAATGRVGPVTGFPIPRYVSIKSSEANARRGPSRSHRIDWVFQRRDMPVMIVAEHGHWRRIVDRDGAGGWMHYTLLSGVRTAIVEAEVLPLRARPDIGAPIRANAERGVIGRLDECRPNWCLMDVGGYRGWVETAVLWGVGAGEVFD